MLIPCDESPLFLHQLGEDAVAGFRVDEGDLPTMGAGPGPLVDQPDAGLLQPFQRRGDVVHRVGDMVRALASKDTRAQFAREHGITSTELEDVVRKGLLRSIGDAENADALDSRLAGLLRGAVERVPLDQLFELVDRLGAF